MVSYRRLESESVFLYWLCRCSVLSSCSGCRNQARKHIAFHREVLAGMRQHKSSSLDTENKCLYKWYGDTVDMFDVVYGCFSLARDLGISTNAIKHKNIKNTIFQETFILLMLQLMTRVPFTATFALTLIPL